MYAEFLKHAGPWGLIIVPAIVVALIMLMITARGLRRGGAAAAFGAFLLAIAGVAGLGAGLTYFVREDALRRVIPACEVEQLAANQRGEAVLLDCESEGLIVAFPVLATVLALGFITIGAVAIRMTRRD